MSEERNFPFSRNTILAARVRQNGKCACCNLEFDRYMLDEVGHHVVPDQFGDKRNPSHTWLGTVDNCAVICENCHWVAHDGGRYQSGPVMPPESFPGFFDGKERSRYGSWCNDINYFWDANMRSSTSDSVHSYHHSPSVPHPVGGDVLSPVKDSGFIFSTGGIFTQSMRGALEGKTLQDVLGLTYDPDVSDGHRFKATVQPAPLPMPRRVTIPAFDWEIIPILQILNKEGNPTAGMSVEPRVLVTVRGINGTSKAQVTFDPALYGTLLGLKLYYIDQTLSYIGYGSSQAVHYASDPGNWSLKLNTQRMGHLRQKPSLVIKEMALYQKQLSSCLKKGVSYVMGIDGVPDVYPKLFHMNFSDMRSRNGGIPLANSVTADIDFTSWTISLSGGEPYLTAILSAHKSKLDSFPPTISLPTTQAGDELQQIYQAHRGGNTLLYNELTRIFQLLALLRKLKGRMTPENWNVLMRQLPSVQEKGLEFTSLLVTLT